MQHRLVTVVFADVVGSTALAQGLGAEDTLAVLGGALQRMADLVEAHQGRVLRFTGDGVKAAFGMDRAREDDAERAVRAGLAIVQAARTLAETAREQHGVTDFAVRVGVHTGDVALGAGVEADDTAMGAAVHIAARMEQSAPPGALRISHDTWNHVRGLFEVEAQAPLEVKGVAAPMSTYLVRAARDRRVASVERGLQGLHTPLWLILPLAAGLAGLFGILLGAPTLRLRGQVRIHRRAQQVVGRCCAVSRDAVHLVERAAGVSQTSAGNHRHIGAADRQRRSQQ